MYFLTVNLKSGPIGVHISLSSLASDFNDYINGLHLAVLAFYIYGRCIKTHILRHFCWC